MDNSPDTTPPHGGNSLYYGILKAKAPRKPPKSSKLKVEVLVTFADGSSKTLQALVDTGSEVSLINPSLVDPALFQPNPRPVRLGVANSHRLPGGKRQTTMVLTFSGRELDTGRKRQLSLPFTAYDAEVVCDIIISYGWMAEHHILPNPRRHGIHFLDDQESLWVGGIVVTKPKDITVLEGLPIHAAQAATTPPGSPRHSLMGDASCSQIAGLWDSR